MFSPPVRFSERILRCIHFYSFCALCLSLSNVLFCALCLALSHKLQHLCFATISLSRLLFPLKMFPLIFVSGRSLLEGKVWGKFIFQKSPFVDSSLLYCTRSRIRAIKYVSLLLSARRTPARALSRYLSLDCARVGVSLSGDTSERVGNKIKSLPRLFRSVCVRVRAFSKDV